MPDASVSSRASEIHRRALIVDGHCDTPYRLLRGNCNLEDVREDAQLDLATLEQSGITASFFAAYVPPFYANRGAADFARRLIGIIRNEVTRNRGKLDLATSSEEIRRVKTENRIALMIGVEGGHAIEDSLDILRELYGMGARYLTLTHVNTNNWADSSGDAPRHGGLTRFGREVVGTMNGLGMLVDISHVSDAAYYHALESSKAPVIASHSSCRALANHPRNMTDQMLRDLAANGGICMINFFSAFVNSEVAGRLVASPKRHLEDTPPGPNEELPDDKTDWDEYRTWFDSLGCPIATIDDVIDHIVHAASTAGIDHVGIGSDFDGVPALPQGLTSAAQLPAVTERLIERGFTESDLLKVLGENFLRVFQAVEKVADVH